MPRGRIQSCLKTGRGHISAMRPIIDVLLPCALQLVRTGPLCQYELRGLFIKATTVTPGRRTKASLSRTTTSCPNNPSPPRNLSATATAGAFAAHPTLVATTLLLAQALMALVHTVVPVFSWWLERDVGDIGIGVKTTRRVGAQGSALRLALGVWKGGKFFRAGRRLRMGERTQAARSELGVGKDKDLERTRGPRSTPKRRKVLEQTDDLIGLIPNLQEGEGHSEFPEHVIRAAAVSQPSSSSISPDFNRSCLTANETPSSLTNQLHRALLNRGLNAQQRWQCTWSGTPFCLMPIEGQVLKFSLYLRTVAEVI